MSSNLSIDECIAIVEKQEGALRFTGFSRRDAWELGQRMVTRILKENLRLSVSIRLLSGFVIFQYASEGTTPNNEIWMTRKYNVIHDLEISGLLNTLRLKKRNQTLADSSLDPKLYAWGGGGFPIHINGTGIIGALMVSGLPHLADHNFIVESLADFLNIKDIHLIPVDTVI